MSSIKKETNSETNSYMKVLVEEKKRAHGKKMGRCVQVLQSIDS